MGEEKSLIRLCVRKNKANELFEALRQTVKFMENLHNSGKIHGAIGPQTMLMENAFCFCFTFPEIVKKELDKRLKRNIKIIDQIDSDFFQHRASGFIPLEQQMKQERVSPASDVYSFCAVVYWWLTGKVPPDVYSRMQGENLKSPWELKISISPKQEAALMKGLSLMEKDRYTNGAELYQALYGQPEVKIYREKRDDNKRYSIQGVGDIIKFGRHEDGSAMQWKILAIDAQFVLLHYAVADTKQCFHNKQVDVSWGKCQLRTWLNRDFIWQHFSTEEEKTLVQTEIATAGETTQDRIFCLSVIEAEEYKEFMKSSYQPWWLRDKGREQGTVVTYEHKKPYESGVPVTREMFIRPAMYILRNHLNFCQ